jgi:hypothetical protein
MHAINFTFTKEPYLLVDNHVTSCPLRHCALIDERLACVLQGLIKLSELKGEFSLDLAVVKPRHLDSF